MKTKILTLFVLLFVSTAFAQTPSVNTAIVVTDLTSVDSATAGAAVTKAGAPVIQTMLGDLSDESISDLKSYGVRNVVIIGGPEVVKWSVDDKLKANDIKVIRLWGIERTGTAIEVAKHFWSGGASCAVIADDTKNSNMDSKRQLAGSNLASRMNCTFIPVPEGTAPADVLTTLKDLNVSTVWYIGKRSSDKIKTKLKEFRLNEIVGDDNSVADKVETEVESTLAKTKLVIVAANDWKSAVAVHANPNDASVVRFVSSIDQLTPLIAKIKEKNITDVRVIGMPDLAQKIADALSAEGINATKISGQNANEISRKIFSEMRPEWRQRRDKAELEDLRSMTKMKTYLLSELPNIENDMNNAETEANSSGAADVKANIDAVQAKLSYIKSSLLTNDVKKARELIADALNTMKRERFDNREKLGININDEINDEENGIENSQADLDSILVKAESDSNSIQNKCNNSEIVQRIVEKAKAIRTSMQEAKASGDYPKTAELLHDAKQLVKTVKHVVLTCKKDNSMSPAAMKIAEKRGVDIKTKRSSWDVEITDSGFSPSVIDISKGDKVRFRNKDNAQHWP
ncbi:hypothetical protein HYZ41_00425, partial [archaeon]|nr:hypothetical protein [archaeon]